MAIRLLFLALTATGAVGAEARSPCLACQASAPALAQVAPPTPGLRDVAGERERPLRVEVVADLDFARVVAGNSGGALAIGADGSDRSEGEVRVIGAGGFTARVAVSGTPNRAVRIGLPSRITLRSPGGQETHITDLTASTPLLSRLGPDGRLDFTIGGRLIVPPGLDGNFRGNIAIDVSYE